MSGKYSIESISDLDTWQAIVESSEQYTMFSSSLYLRAFGGKYRLFLIKKGSEVKAGLHLLLSDDEKEVVMDDMVIYSGILSIDDKEKKEVSSRAERFRITESIIAFLTDRYIKIEMALSPSLEDMRPFLWHNYSSDDPKEKFLLDLRYTSYLDISELNDVEGEEETALFKGLETLRQRNIRKARQERSVTTEAMDIELFIRFYEELMSRQDVSVTKSRLHQMSKIIEMTIEHKSATMIVTRNSKEEVIYMAVFSFDRRRAYYLFGAGDFNAVENYKGTICFWDGFIILANRYGIKEVDLEGVNSPNRGRFKLSFGGSLKPYYKIAIDQRV